MPAGAIIGAAVIGAGASLISSKNASKAASQATQAQVQSNQQSLDLQRDIYNQNRGILSPFVDTGYAANDRLKGLLNIGGDVGAARSAFDGYRASTGYDFRVGEGQRALNTGYAARGVLNSGAAQKALVTFGQNQASDEFGRYVSALQGQQQVGLSAGNALAGVGTTFANNATNINNSTGAAIGNGALANASIQNGFMNSLAGITGNTIGALSSYGGGSNPAGNYWGISGNKGIY